MAESSCMSSSLEGKPGSLPGPESDKLCNRGQVTSAFWISTSLLEKQGYTENAPASNTLKL